MCFLFVTATTTTNTIEYDVVYVLGTSILCAHDESLVEYLFSICSYVITELSWQTLFRNNSYSPRLLTKENTQEHYDKRYAELILINF